MNFSTDGETYKTFQHKLAHEGIVRRNLYQNEDGTTNVTLVAIAGERKEELEREREIKIETVNFS